MDQEIQSPYGNRTLNIRGTDVPAVDGLKGQGDEPAFNRTATVDGQRQINASSKADLMAQIGAIRRNAQAAGGLRTAEVDSKAANERWAQFKAAYRNTSDSKPMSVIGEVMSDEIWETLGREGFTNKILAIQNIGKGATGRVRVRRKDVVAYQVTSDVKVQEQRIRQLWVYPPEFYIQCFILIEDKEIEQSSADLLDEKFQDGLEAVLVKEDKITKALLDRSISTFNDVVYYTTFNPTVFTTIRTQVMRWGTPAQNMLLAWDVWDDIISDPDFVAWWDPVTKHELVLEGHLGRLLNVELHTDGLRYPTLQVLQPGNVYITGSPITVGTKVIRKELDSRAIDQYNVGRAARGWFMHTIQSQIVVSGRATAGAVRLP
jgi:hypothetical protein